MAATARGFVPPSDWPELEAARVAHERALEEHMSEESRRQEARAQERALQEHLATVQKSQRQAKDEATKVVKRATIDALRVVAEHGEAWLAKIAAERAEALAEADEHRAALEAAEARARKDERLEAWIKQAMTASVPQPFGADAGPVAA
ncbi:MAG: hypothetical protein ACLGI5_20790 [Thermoleophilia bacterium]